MRDFIAFFKSLGTIPLLIISGVAVALIIFFAVIMSRIEGTQMSLLYKELNSSDASAIVSYLEKEEESYELSDEGQTIYVPSDRVNRLRLLMAENSLPSGGGVGYEIFDRSDRFGVTSFEQNISHLRALEGELQRTISSMKSIKKARVHLVLMKRELFSKKVNKPSASIVLTLSNGLLESENVSAIQYLVASAVPELKASNVSIVDDRGHVWSRGTGDEDHENWVAKGLNEQKILIQNRLRHTIERLLENIVGQGRVRSEVYVDMDFQNMTTHKEIFDPDSRVLRSERALEEGSESTDRDPKSVAVSNNLPDANNQDNLRQRTQESRSEEYKNFEISKEVTQITKNQGDIKRISVSVLLDGVYTFDDQGESTYRPRSPEELVQINNLVKGVIGFSQDRGDRVEVLNMRFAQDFEPQNKKEESNLWFGMDKQDLFYFAELIALTIVAILVILLIIRPLLNRVFDAFPAWEPNSKESDQADAGELEKENQKGNQLTSDDKNSDDDFVDLSNVVGSVRGASIRKISDYVEKNPETVISIIRNWLYQGR